MSEVALSTRGSDASKSRAEGGGRQRTSLHRWIADAPAAYLLLLPVLVLFGFAVIYPLVQTIVLSLWDIRGLGKPKFIGLGNFIALVQDANFRQAATTTLLWTFFTTAISVGAGWGIALLCSIAPKQTLIPRVIIFAAFGVSEAVIGYVWLQVYRGDTAGLLNAILAGLGLGGLAHAWLGDAKTAIWCLIIAYSWAQTGLPLLVIFAATQAISRNVLEAAYVDGATPMGIMRHIIAPLSMPGVRVALFINLLGSLRAFDTIYVLTGGGPVRSTETIGYFMFRESFTQFKLGYGAAATLILLAAVLLVSIPAIVQRTKSTT
ncbi:MAG TPA: sugar ABC transporter permease [Devosia sp.]|jgi:ABC-type sugar transport system permease subunit|nr:sugar ABC transporter permease [Devosia sp.]